jgi:aryl-alcohol dehydrogenase-like predicted oxidoreductase
LSRLGLGAWAFGRTGWGLQHDHDSIAAILRAVELGITWIDTAAVYGDGHSERVVGRALRELPESDRPLVFTKGGLRVDPSSGTTFRDLRPSSLRAECEESLQRLDVDRLDLYQLHWPVDDPLIVERAWETLGELQHEGKIRWRGVSNFDVDMLDRCAAHRPVEAIQVPLSLLSRESGGDLLPWADAHNAHALIYSPLESGLLSGGFSLQRLHSLPANDWRSRRPSFQRPHFDHALNFVERLRVIASDLGASLTEIAVAWTLNWPGVAGVIVGARRPEQVDAWAGASRLTLDPHVRTEIADALNETGAGAGPVQPLLTS